MTALLLALTFLVEPGPPLLVTRHVRDGGVCAMVSGINPAAFALQVRSVGADTGKAHAIPVGTESFCIPLFVPIEGTKYFEVRQVYPVPCSSGGGATCGDPELSWYREVPLSCKDPAGNGCNTLIYVKEP